MAAVVLNIGAATPLPNFLGWAPPADREIPAALSTENSISYLRNLQVFGVDGSILLYYSSLDTGNGLDAGPELTTAWEVNPQAVKLSVAGHDFVIRGPNAPGVMSSDDEEPYAWNPGQDAVIDGFLAAYFAATAAQRAATTLTLDDGLEAPSFSDDTGDAISGTVGTAITPVTVPEADGDPEPTYAASGLPAGLSFDTATRVLSGTPTAAGSGTITVTATNSAGTADWTVTYAFVAGTPTDQTVSAEGRHDTRSAVTVSEEAPPLVLADSDDTGLDVDCKALLVASDDATTGNFFYEDADRGGTDDPLDGELGLGDDDTVISGVRRRTATILQLNDNNNPAALDIGAYFAAGGAGNDLTVYLQTLADGEVSFTVASAVSFSRVDQVRFTLPADAQTLLDNLEDGDRWIFKLARPEAVTPTDQTVSAEGRHETRGEAAITETPGPATDQVITGEGRHETRGQAVVTEETPPPTPATDQLVTAEGRHETRGKTTITEEAPSAATDQPVTAEGRHATRGEATVSQVAATPATDQAITAEGRHATRGEGVITQKVPTIDTQNGIWVSIDGNVVEVEPGWSIDRPAGMTATMRFQLMGRYPEHFTYIGQDGDEIEARAGGRSGVLIFGGYVDAPRIRQSRGNQLITVNSVGWRHRLNDRLLTQVEGIDIVQMDTAAEQLEALIDLLSGEGFTADVALATPDVPYRGDMRFGYAGPLMDAIAALNDAIVSVLPNKKVPVRSRGNITRSHLLAWEQVAEIGFEGSRQDYRTRHVVRCGDLLQLEVLVGKTNGRYRLGGAQNLVPALSFFNATVADDGIEWIDERARPLSGLRESLLLARADAVEWPVSVVPAGDRLVHGLTLSAEGLILRGPTVPANSTAGLAVRASDGSEWGWPLAGFTPRAGRLFVINSVDSGHGEGLFHINPTNANQTIAPYGFVGGLPYGAEGPLAAHLGELYGVQRTSDHLVDRLWRINPDSPLDETGRFGLVGDMPAGVTETRCMTSHGGRLIFVNQTTSPGIGTVYSIDPEDMSDVDVLGVLPGGAAKIRFPAGIASHDGRLLLVDDRTGVLNAGLWNINPENPGDESGDFGLISFLDFMSPSAMTSYEGSLLITYGTNLLRTIPDANNPTAGDSGQGQLAAFDTGLAYLGGGSAIPLSSLGIFNDAELEEIVAKIQVGDSKLVLVDTAEPRVDLSNRVLRAVGGIVEVEVLTLESLNVDGTDTPTGSGEWRWDVTTQALIQDPPDDPPPTSIVAKYKARYVVEQTTGTVPFVDRSTINADLPDPDAGEAFAQGQIDLHRRPREALPVKILAGSGLDLNEGEGIGFIQEIIDELSIIEGATEDDVFRIDRLKIGARGLLLAYDLRVLRRADEQRFRDQWRTGVFQRQ